MFKNRHMNFPAFIITFINGVARSLHFVFFIIIGNRFGADHNTDTVLLIQAPLLILVSVTAGIAEAVIMPGMHRAFVNKSTGNLLKLIQKKALVFVTLATAMLLVSSFILNKGAPLLLFAILFPIPLLSTFSSISIGILNASGKYRYAVMGPFYGALISIPVALFLPVSAYSFALALLGFEAGRFSGLRLHTHASLYDYYRNHSSRSSHIELWTVQGARYQALGSLFSALNPFIDYLFARQLGVGALTYIEYASRLWNLVPIFFTGQLILFYAEVSRLSSENKRLSGKVHGSALKLASLALLLSGIFIFASTYLVDLIYGHGKLNNQGRNVLSELLSCYFLGSAPFLAGLAYIRAFNAQGNIYIITWVAGASVLVNFTLNYLFTGLFGLKGIGLATSATYLFTMILLGVSFHKKHGT